MDFLHTIFFYTLFMYLVSWSFFWPLCLLLHGVDFYTDSNSSHINCDASTWTQVASRFLQKEFFHISVSQIWFCNITGGSPADGFSAEVQPQIGLSWGGGFTTNEPCGQRSQSERSHQRRGVHWGRRCLLCPEGQRWNPYVPRPHNFIISLNTCT